MEPAMVLAAEAEDERLRGPGGGGGSGPAAAATLAPTTAAAAARANTTAEPTPPGAQEEQQQRTPMQQPHSLLSTSSIPVPMMGDMLHLALPVPRDAASADASSPAHAICPPPSLPPPPTSTDDPADAASAKQQDKMVEHVDAPVRDMQPSPVDVAELLSSGLDDGEEDLTSRLNRHMQIKATSQEQEEVKRAEPLQQPVSSSTSDIVPLSSSDSSTEPQPLQQSEQQEHPEPHPASLAQRLKHTLRSKVQRAKKKLEAIKQQQQQKRNLQQEAATIAAETHPFNSPASPAIVSPGVSASRSPPQPTSHPQQLYSPILDDREDGNGGHLTRELLQSVYNTRAEPRPWPMFSEDEEDKDEHNVNVKEDGEEEESEIKQADQPPSWLSESFREQSSPRADEQKSMQQPQPLQQQAQGEYASPPSAASRLRNLLSAVMERVQYVLETGEFGAPPPPQPQQQPPTSSSRNVSQANTQHLLESLHPTSTASLTSFSSGKSSQAQPNPQQQQEPAPQVQKQEPPASQRPLQPQALRRARSESKSENYDACVMHPASLPTPDELEDAEAQLMQATDDKTNDERPPLQGRRQEDLVQLLIAGGGLV